MSANEVQTATINQTPAVHGVGGGEVPYMITLLCVPTATTKASSVSGDILVATTVRFTYVYHLSYTLRQIGSVV